MAQPGMTKIGKQAVYVPAEQLRVPLASVPKTNYLPPQAGSTNGAWQSSGLFLDFEVPKNVGVLDKTTLRFEINNTGQSNVSAPGTHDWVQQIEIYVGSTLLETLYPNEIYNESVGFLTSDDLDIERSVLKYTSDNSGALVPGPAEYYLPFNNCLTTAGLYCRGVIEPVKFRVYFPAGLFPAAITLAAATLVIDEKQGTTMDQKQWDIASARGVVYSTVVRQRQNTAITKIGDADYTLELTGVNGSSAGYLVYAGPVVVPGGTVGFYPFGNGASSQVAANTLLQTRYAIRTLELDDKMGNKRTEQLRGDSLLSLTWKEHVGTPFTSYTHNNTYLLPFCTNFRNAVETGVYQGELYSDGTDRLVIRGVPHNSTLQQDVWNLTVCNYVYQGLVFQHGRLVNVLKNTGGAWH